MKKIINIILIIAVIIIYSKLAWNQLYRQDSNTTELISRIPFTENKNTIAEYHLDYNFIDPFLKQKNSTIIHEKKQQSLKTTTNKPTPSPKDETLINPIEISYLGRIVNLSKKESKALIKYKNQEVIVSPGDSIDNFKIIDIGKTQLIIKINHKTREYDIKK